MSKPSIEPVPRGAAYRTLWRWHFYAGLFVMPFLLVLAITGTLYCFQPQIEPLLYHDRFVVPAQAGPRLPIDALLARAVSAEPSQARATAVRVTTDPERSAEFVFRLSPGDSESVYLNPYTGAVLGRVSIEHRLMQVDRMLHRKLLLGRPGELLMELAACWTLVMVGTGIALWWPRGPTRARALLAPDPSLTGRPFWKSLHAAMGIWLAIGAVAFVLTGLPWSNFWGRNFKALATTASLGAPAGSWGDLPLRSGQAAGASSGKDAVTGDAQAMETMPGMTMDEMPLTSVPWAVGAVHVPTSTGGDGRRPWSIASVVDRLHGLGLSDGYELALPASTEGVFTATYFPPDPKGERTIYLDQFSGAVIKDIRYEDYGGVAKAISYGTALHMGRYFGLANQIVCSLISLGLAAMAGTGFVMWWKRRPSGTLGAPAPARRAPPLRGWVAALIVMGVVFPLMGVSLVVVWLVDRFVLGGTSRRLAIQ